MLEAVHQSHYDVGTIAPYKTLVRALEPIYKDRGRVAFWEAIASKMNDAAQRTRAPWGWRYMLNIYNGTQQPSAAFMRAVYVLSARLEVTSPEMAAATPAIVFTLPDRVKPGSLILGASKECAYRYCDICFVPVVPHQRYHSLECCRREYRLRKMEDERKS